MEFDNRKDKEGIYKEYYKNDFEEWDKQSEISYNNNHIRQRERYRFFQHVFDYMVGSDTFGDYYEFGCHKARTFRMALSEARKKNFTDMSFHAFDSFEGLPEIMGTDEHVAFAKGDLKTTPDEFDRLVSEHGLFLDKVYKVKGFYDKSLTKELQADYVKLKNKVALTYIDCDLYESTVPVLDFIDPLLQEGSVVAFDDWFIYRGHPNKGEIRAFREFRERSEWVFEPYIDIPPFGKTFLSVCRK